LRRLTGGFVQPLREITVSPLHFGRNPSWHGLCKGGNNGAALVRRPAQPKTQKKTTMKNATRTLALTALLCGLTLGSLPLGAQEQKGEPRPDGNRGDRGGPPGGRTRGNFNPEEFRQRISERMKEQFGVTNDDEWKLIY
jgi:hypothetical protein